MAKQRTNSADVALPGLESVVMPLDMRPADVDMSDGKTYTAAVLFKDHPRVFKSACELMFRNGLSIRSVAAALYLSVNTVRAIRDMVLDSHGRTCDAAAAAFFIKSRVAQARRIVQLRALEAVEDKLRDEDELSKVSIDTLISAVKSIDDIERQSAPDKPTKVDDNVYDVDADAFDSVMDGLDGEKKRAREDGADSAADRPGNDAVGVGSDAVDDGDDAGPSGPGGDGGDDFNDLEPFDQVPECSTRDTVFRGSSSALSEDNADLRGFSGALCNSLCNSVEDADCPGDDADTPRAPAQISPGASSAAPSAPAAPASSKDPGGGGVPGGAAPGGVD